MMQSDQGRPENAVIRHPDIVLASLLGHDDTWLRPGTLLANVTKKVGPPVIGNRRGLAPRYLPWDICCKAGDQGSIASLCCRLHAEHQPELAQAGRAERDDTRGFVHARPAQLDKTCEDRPSKAARQVRASFAPVQALPA